MGGNSPEARCPRPSANTQRTTASRHCTPASRRASPATRAVARRKTRRTAGRGAEREGHGYRERQTPAGHQARGRHRSAGQQIGLSRAAGHQDADRHAAGHRKRAEPAAAEKNPFSPTDKEVVQQLVARLRPQHVQRLSLGGGSSRWRNPWFGTENTEHTVWRNDDGRNP